MRGWLRLHRQILQWEWYSCTNTTRVFIHLLLTASWRNARWKGVEIPRGSVFASPDTLATATGLSRQQVRTVLTRLKSTSEITTQSTSKGTLITLCNFETYNSAETDSNQHFNQPDNQKLTSVQPAFNQPLTTSEEGKKVKKERTKNNGLAESLSIPSDFSEEVQSALSDWKKHRTEIRKKITGTQWERLVDDCRKSPAVMVAAIHKSIVSGWQGIFPEKETAAQDVSKPKQSGPPRWLPENWRDIAKTALGREMPNTWAEVSERDQDDIYNAIQREREESSMPAMRSA